MASPINSLAIPKPDTVTNEDGFRLMLETHKPYFRQSGNYDVHVVDTHLAYKYRYDLYGYLAAQKVNPELHWVTMRLNEIENPTEFDNVGYDVLYIPKSTAYTKLKGLYATSLGKVGK